MNYKIITMSKNEEKNILMEISETEFSKIMDDIEFLKISMLSIKSMQLTLRLSTVQME